MAILKFELRINYSEEIFIKTDFKKKGFSDVTSYVVNIIY